MTKCPKRIRIAQLGPAHPYRGGIVHFNNRLAKALEAIPELEVYQYFWTKLYPECLLPGPASDWLDLRSRVSFQVSGRNILNYANPWSWWQFVRRIRSDGCRILVTHWVHPVHFPVFVTVFAALRLLTDVEIHLIVHNVRPHEDVPGATQMARTVMNLAHHVTVHNASERDIAKKIMNVQTNIKTAFHPVYDFFTACEDSEYLRKKIRLKKRVILFFGFIRPYKGLECLISAFEIFQKKNNDVSLLIVGKFIHTRKKKYGNSEYNLLQNLIKKNKSIIHINEYIPNEDVGIYFGIADTLVTPYHKVSQSGPVQIAFALGIPVIASDLPAFRDCIEEGVTGSFFNPGDPQDLARAMEGVLGQAWDSDRIKAHGQRFGWERYVEILLDGDVNS
jgi:glycosyltransferase involved in cell wall biosynthesis